MLPRSARTGDDRSTIATWLHADGYETGLFGKYLNSYTGGVPPGWDRWVAFDYEPSYYPLLRVHEPPRRCPGRPACRLKREVSTYSTKFFGNAATQLHRHRPGQEAGVRLLRPVRAAPAVVPPGQVREPLANLPQYRPPSYNEADVSDKPPWIRALPRFDNVENQQILAQRQAEYQTLSRSTRRSEHRRVAEATHRLAHSVILFASDNGVSWGEHRLTVGSKQVPYDEALRVPLVVRFEPDTTTPSPTTT